MIGESQLGGPESPDPSVMIEDDADGERAHAARVAAHRAVSGWGPESAVELASLTSHIGRLRRQSPIGAVPAVLAVLVGVADLTLTGVAIVSALAGRGDRADEGVLLLLAMFVPTVWAAWTLTRLAQSRREHLHQAARERLRLAGSCGDPDCVRCR